MISQLLMISGKKQKDNNRDLDLYCPGEHLADCPHIYWPSPSTSPVGLLLGRPPRFRCPNVQPVPIFPLLRAARLLSGLGGATAVPCGWKWSSGPLPESITFDVSVSGAVEVIVMNVVGSLVGLIVSSAQLASAWMLERLSTYRW